MLKNRVAVRKACLLAGVDSTLPLTMSAIMRGYNPLSVAELVDGLLSEPIDMFISPMVQIDAKED